VARRKRTDIEVLILELLGKKSEIGVHEVAEEAGLSKTDEADRKAILRGFKALIHRGLLRAKGAARARVYYLKEGRSAPKTAFSENAESRLKEIPLTKEAQALLHYLGKPVQARRPAGYSQNFLRSYDPKRTFYLDASQREMLLASGRTENAQRPAGTYARNILNRLLIDLSWNSSRLEGNTYSLLETKRLIELGETVIGKDATEAQMILNHKAAIEYIIESIAETEISSHEICSIHALLSENLLGDPSASGRLRQIAVGISGTTYVPLENPHVLKESFELFIGKLNQIEDPFEQSFFSLVHLSYIQAFEDVNKRTARLVANIPLIKQNLKPLSFTDVDRDAYAKSLIGIYEKNDISLFRDLYLWAYQRSSQRYSAIQQSLGEPNLLKLKYRQVIQDIIRTVVTEKVAGTEVVTRVRSLLEALNLPPEDSTPLFQVIETEIVSLHDGNVARFKIRPSEFQEWKALQ